jgi:hypothetical protein
MLVQRAVGSILFETGLGRSLADPRTSKFETGSFSCEFIAKPHWNPFDVETVYCSYAPAHSSDLDYSTVFLFDAPTEPIDVYAEPDDDFRNTIAALKALVAKLEEEPFSWGPQEGERLTAETSRNAQLFLDLLPTDRELPKVAPDGDGGLYMAWERPGRPTVIVGVTGDRLFAVVNPGTAKSRHVPEARFDGSSIPGPILDVIPKRS